LKRSAVTHRYWVRATAPQAQLREVIQRFDLQRLAQPFTRCLCCNGLLQSATLAQVKDEVPENATRFYADFWRCNSCSKIFWQGSHYQRMLRLIEDIQFTIEGAENAEHE
ncbi:MAG TPA: Mut7-C RNAse domain-containing protein, partial [Anaerolineae bacterium]|nr:Mut7-C RNAse domain-containing protein [Anaerolineae bacterium]